jgi:hypothetical protein
MSLSRNGLYIACTLGMLFAIVWFRLLPHEANLSPVLAIALFAGAWFSNRLLGGLLAVAAVALSDLYLGFHSTIPYVYGSIVLCSFVGSAFKRKSESLVELGLASLVAASIFFLITNFGVWLSTAYYPKTWSGLLECYSMAVPFFRSSLIGTFVGSVVLFAGERMIRQITIPILLRTDATCSPRIQNF